MQSFLLLSSLLRTGHLDRTLRTELHVDARAVFQEYSPAGDAPSDVTFSLKDLRVMAALCEHLQARHAALVSAIRRNAMQPWTEVLMCCQMMVAARHVCVVCACPLALPCDARRTTRCGCDSQKDMRVMAALSVHLQARRAA